MTIGYTMCAGIWKMIFELNKAKSTLHMEVFSKFVAQYDHFVGSYFDHIKPLLRHQNTEKMSMYLGNNGITNMVSIFIRMYNCNFTDVILLVPRILRALHSFEVWNGIRRLYKNKEDSAEIAKAILYKLLGIDLAKYKEPTAPLFKDERANIKFHDEPNVNHAYLTELFKPLFYVNYLTLVPTYVKVAVKGPMEGIKDIQPINDQFVLKSLDIDYGYKDFLLFSVFQAALYTTRADREDSENEKMKILDLKNYKEAMKDVKDYIRAQFEAEYEADLTEKRKAESDRMGEFVASKILASTTYEELVSVWRDGVKRTNVVYKISTQSSPGFKMLCEKIRNPDEIIPLRSAVFRILFLGVDDKDVAVWNHGGVCFIHNMKAYKEAFLKSEPWAEWNEIMKEFKARGKHIYRDPMANRKGHSNTKPSFWAMGYADFVEFRKAITEDEFISYCKEHRRCCGVRDLEESFLNQLGDVEPAKRKFPVRRGRGGRRGRRF